MFIDYEKPYDHENSPTLRYLIVTDTALVVGEPTVENHKVFYLRGWNTLFKLHKIRREKDKPNVIQFIWDDDALKEWTLKFEQTEQFMQHISFTMETLGVKIERKEYKKKMIAENEVTKEALQNANFENQETLDLIAVYEDILNNDLTIDNVNGLLSLYQKAIEYYSALDSGRYEDFLNRNRMLLSREDVQVLLTSKIEDQPPAPQLNDSVRKESEDVFKIESDSESEHTPADKPDAEKSAFEDENAKQEEVFEPKIDTIVDPEVSKVEEPLIDISDHVEKVEDIKPEEPKSEPEVPAEKVENKPSDPLDDDPFSIGEDEDEDEDDEATELLDSQPDPDRIVDSPSAPADSEKVAENSQNEV